MGSVRTKGHRWHFSAELASMENGKKKKSRDKLEARPGKKPSGKMKALFEAEISKKWISGKESKIDI